MRAVLTDKGREAYAAGQAAQAQAERELVEGLSADDRARLAALLRNLTQAA